MKKAVVSPAPPRGRSIDECLAALEAGPDVEVDPGFAADVEEGIRAHADERLRGLGIIVDSTVWVGNERRGFTAGKVVREILVDAEGAEGGM